MFTVISYAGYKLAFNEGENIRFASYFQFIEAVMLENSEMESQPNQKLFSKYLNFKLI